MIKCSGTQAYKLKLPAHLKFHYVFHVSLLKQYIPREDQVLKDDEIVMSSQSILELQPSRILETQERVLRNRILIEHLFQWKDYPEEDATWEDEVTLLRDCPKIFSR